MTLAEIAATTDADIDFGDIQECDETFWEHAKRIEPDGVHTAAAIGMNFCAPPQKNPIG